VQLGGFPLKNPIFPVKETSVRIKEPDTGKEFRKLIYLHTTVQYCTRLYCDLHDSELIRLADSEIQAKSADWGPDWQHLGHTRRMAFCCASVRGPPAKPGALEERWKVLASPAAPRVARPRREPHATSTLCDREFNQTSVG